MGINFTIVLIVIVTILTILTIATILTILTIATILTILIVIRPSVVTLLRRTTLTTLTFPLSSLSQDRYVKKKVHNKEMIIDCYVRLNYKSTLSSYKQNK